jgi:putative ABC transport system permease protein
MAEWHDVARLAFRDYSHEWHISGCFILGLAAVLAPLLVLFGLKYGLVTSMLTALAEDPEKRELKPLGSGHYTAAWFRGMRARPEVAFVSPRTRTLAATLELSSKTAPVILPAELIPSGQHDPLLKGLQRRPAGLHEVVLSRSAAERLKVRKGAVIEASLSRQYQAGTSACAWTSRHFLAALLLTLIASLLGAMLGGVRAARIEPSDGLREV